MVWALLGLTTDKLVGNEDGLVLVRNLMEDVIKIAASCGIQCSPEIIAEKINLTLIYGFVQDQQPG